MALERISILRSVAASAADCNTVLIRLTFLAHTVYRYST